MIPECCSITLVYVIKAKAAAPLINCDFLLVCVVGIALLIVFVVIVLVVVVS